MDVSAWSWAAVAVMAIAVLAPLTKRLPATLTLLIANLLIFGMGLFGPTRDTVPGHDFVGRFPVIDAELAFSGRLFAAGDPQGYLQMGSAMFLHGSVAHILGNSIFLYFFGTPFEERIGPRRFMAIYILGGLAATMAQFAMTPESRGLGASGAIAAIMGAFVVKYPRLIVPLPVPVFIVIILRVPVFVGVGIFVALQLIDVIALQGGISGVGYGAHFGGLAAGAVLGLLVVRGVATGPGARSDGRVAVDLPKLVPFARDDQTRQVLAHMQTNHDEPEVFQAWLDRFFRTATCPTCSQRVTPSNRGHVECTQGHRFDVRQGAPTTAVATPAAPNP